MRTIAAMAWVSLAAGCAVAPTGEPKAAAPPPPSVPGVQPPVPTVPVRPALAVDLTKFEPQGTVQGGYNADESRVYLWSNGHVEAPVRIAEGGEYEILLTASCQAALGEFAKFAVYVDGERVGEEVALASEEPRAVRVAGAIAAGDRKLALRFTNDAYKEGEYDRNLYFHKVELRRVK